MNVLEIFSKNFRISDFMKIRPVGAEFHADGRANRETDGQTDGHDEANSSFLQSCETA